MSTPVITQLGRDDIRARWPAFADLYRDAYTNPPYQESEDHVAAFVDRLTGELDQAGFSLVAAIVDGTVVGFAHGAAFPAGRWWSHAGTPPEEVRDRPVFAVIELVVHSGARRQGLGRSLLTTLLADRPEPFATLCANHDVPAREIYRRWGWRQVDQVGQSPVGPLDVLILDLPKRRSFHRRPGGDPT